MSTERKRPHHFSESELKRVSVEILDKKIRMAVTSMNSPASGFGEG